MRSANARMNCDGIDPLPVEMAGVEVEAEFFAMVERLERSFGGENIEGDLGRVDFQREFHAALAEHVQDRVPAFGEQSSKPASIMSGGTGGKSHEQVPDAAAGEAVDDCDAELRWPPGRSVLISSAARWRTPSGIAVAPDVWRQDRLVTLVDRDRSTACPTRWLLIAKHCRSFAVEDLPAGVAVVVLGQGALRLRSGRPSRRARGRRSQSRLALRASSSRGKSAH